MLQPGRHRRHHRVQELNQRRRGPARRLQHDRQLRRVGGGAPVEGYGGTLRVPEATDCRRWRSEASQQRGAEAQPFDRVRDCATMSAQYGFRGEDWDDVAMAGSLRAADGAGVGVCYRRCGAERAPPALAPVQR